ncbi:MAG: 3'(2'),5'-bisphosphate nucleotidase CysQ [Rhodobacteraceae bacterium]|nr:3'(2'),5'-bisphosphate nucleotidase CysQ [Paracoccaceae bacterium]MCP5342765.1 3'(2'),5'-bisphosphate nucleotidase CysQ [Paracoccaceae bacterium]
MRARDLALLSDAAYAAGDIARRFWRKGARQWDKADGAGPVTEADLAINDMLADSLRNARPDYGWLSEESPDAAPRLAARRTFIIDPIDGTRAFIAGEKTFAHSLAIADQGRIVAAVVYLPIHDTLYAATDDGAAMCNGRPIRASARVDARDATLLTARSNMAAEHWVNASPPPFKREFRASLAYRLCLVAEGRYDAMLTLRPTWEWDIAAGDLIARQAGAMVTDQTGARLGFNAADPRARGVIAAPAPLWQILHSGLNQP